MDFSTMTVEQIAAYISERREAFNAIVALKDPTSAQVAEAEGIATSIEEAEAAATSMKDRFAALQQRFNQGSQEDPDKKEARTIADPKEVRKADVAGDPEHKETVVESPGEVVPPGEVAPDEPEDEVVVREKVIEDEGKAGGRVVALASRTKRPAAPTITRKPVAITAAADVQGFAAGQSLELQQVAEAVISRARGFSPPSGTDPDAEPDLRKFGTAQFRVDFDPEATVDRWDDADDAMKYVTDEANLPGGSLVAAGGWCSPSETVYDLDQDATTEGMLSLPEIGVRRGGIRYAQSPEFSVFYANPGFIQTEAQAIAGTTKPCIEVPCPSFQDVRLDAEGICIKVPILTNAAYPEVVTNFVSGSLIAHQHWMNANIIGRLVTFAGAARVLTGIGSTVDDTMGGLELLADQRRQKYRLGLNTTMEVVVPFWVKGALRSDLAARTGQDAPVTDQQIAAHWTGRNLNVQYVYDWQLLPTVDVGGTAGTDEAMTYPTTFQALMYPAGTFVKGTADVINLNTVYDAASLAVNVYTGLFMEQGFLVAKKKFDADLVTLPVCSSGRTGAHDLTCTAANWA